VTAVLFRAKCSFAGCGRLALELPRCRGEVCDRLLTYPQDQALLDFLAAQRAAVLSIVAGLDEGAWHRSAVPSGWTPAGLVEHLGGAEWHWFQGW
jgi:hypothetical protein